MLLFLSLALLRFVFMAKFATASVNPELYQIYNAESACLDAIPKYFFIIIIIIIITNSVECTLYCGLGRSQTISGGTRNIPKRAIDRCLNEKTSPSNSMTCGSEPFAKSALNLFTNSKDERSMIFFNSVS